MRVLGVVLVILLSILPVPAATQQEYPASATIRGENIWLRVDPAEDTEIVRYLQRGDRVRVTAGATPADGDTFYPVEVLATGETGWVRELAIDPRTVIAQAEDPEPVVVEMIDEPEPAVDAPGPDEETARGEDESPRRARNNRERETPEADLEVVAEPAPVATEGAGDPNLPNGGTFETWQIVVAGIERPLEILNLADEANPFRPQGRFEIVFVGVTNVGEAAASFPRDELILRDRSGREFTQHMEATSDIVASRDLETADFPPGVTSRTAIVFDVPAGAEGLQLSTRDDDFRIPLAPPG